MARRLSERTRYEPRSTRAARLRVEEVGHCLLVSSGEGRGSANAIANGLAAEPGRIAVIMADPALARRPELAERLRHWVPLKYEAVRLIAPGAATRDADGYAPAQLLAEMLDVEVVAPDGDLLAVPGGTMFARARSADDAVGSWWRFRPGRPAEPAGRRYPAPEWERELAEFTDPGSPELLIEEIPAGLWVRWAGNRRAVSSDDLAFAIPVDERAVALLVSRPDDAPLRAADLRRIVAAIPEKLQERLVLIPYGDKPVTDGALGAVASLAANRTLRARTGLPLHLAGRGNHVVVIGTDGLPAWTPFAKELAWRPQGGARLLSWTSPASQLLPVGQGQLLINERWLVEIVEAGLWIREVDRADGAALVRQLPIEADHCTIVLGDCAAGGVQPPWRTVVKLLRRLPVEAQRRLRLAIPEAAGDALAWSAVRACRQVLVAGGEICVLGADGFRPWRAAAREDARELGRREFARRDEDYEDYEYYEEDEGYEEAYSASVGRRESERPVRDERPVREERPLPDERPVREERPLRDERPSRDEWSRRDERPSRDEWSRRDERPSRDERSWRDERPSRDEWSRRDERPSRDERSWRDERPVRAARPTREERRDDRAAARSERRMDRAEANDMHRLLSFVDQIRHTPAWDEMPEERDDDPRETRARSRVREAGRHQQVREPVTPFAGYADERPPADEEARESTSPDPAYTEMPEAVPVSVPPALSPDWEAAWRVQEDDEPEPARATSSARPGTRDYGKDEER